MAGALDDFTRDEFSHDGKARELFRLGDGPAVIVIAELPGITPKVAEFARRVSGLGCTAVMPSLFGEPGAEASVGSYLRSTIPACISREFRAFALHTTTPISRWLRALAAHEHDRSGGPGVGAVGMCFTGGFALGMMVDERMLAPVLSQPSLPLGLGRRHRSELGVSDADLERIRARACTGTQVLGLRFTGDALVPADRFERLRRELGDAFIGVEIDSSPGNAWAIPRNAHSVLTEHLVDEPGHPTHDALEQVLAFLRDRLVPGPERPSAS
jgi:dienelactone hydrolase